jgi:regulator of protease activity HflC (stomatin/prohibitin superfamily)
MSDRSLILTIVGGILVGLLALSGIVWLCGASNPLTDAGYVGYVTHGSVFGSSRFYGLQRGPASPGRTWLLNVVNVSITPYTYDEKFEKTDKNDTRILAKDNVAVSFEVHLIWRVKPDRVREFVEKFAAIHDGTQPDVVVGRLTITSSSNSFVRSLVMKSKVETGLRSRTKSTPSAKPFSIKRLPSAITRPFRSTPWL